MDNFYFAMEREKFGGEEFGPYDSYVEAANGLLRVVFKCETTQEIERTFTQPYTKNYE